ncbi:MAG: peptidase [Marmoricola sp.]|nr:peptidase [Marmoricola sp.]
MLARWSVVAGTLCLAVATVPGSIAPAHAARAVHYRVAGGTLLHPLAPRLALPVAAYRLTGRFGDTSGLWHHAHTGLDFAAPSGTTIRSVTAGRVIEVGYDGRYGNKTVVLTRGGTELWYCHQRSVAVTVGERVHAGEPIGAVGSTGNVTGPHLHLEVRPVPDRPVDPDRWLQRQGVSP